MKTAIHGLLAMSAALLAACGNGDAPADATTTAEKATSAHVVMDNDLAELKEDFNANAGRVRLMFLNGPTCGICLRGMADLNDAFVAASQGDDRLVTFVVHVPTMGAEEHHAVDSMPLLDGPRVRHYWEQSGIIGGHYREAMNVDLYVWDFWAIYGPDAEWSGTLPPVPDYYEHQLGVSGGDFAGFPEERMLDAERFAEKTREYLERVDESRFAREAGYRPPESERLADGTVIPYVGQPRSVAVRQHIMGRGGYRDLKRIRTIEARGRIESNGVERPLVVHAERPDVLRRVVGTDAASSVGERDADGEVRLPAGAARGLPPAFEAALLESFEFDGLFVEWQDKGHDVSMLGMRKFGDVLAWQLHLVQADGRRWHLYVDSHTGDLVRASLLGDDGEPRYVIDQREFADTAGFRFPHRLSYRDGGGELLATETFDTIAVETAPTELARESGQR